MGMPRHMRLIDREATKEERVEDIVRRATEESLVVVRKDHPDGVVELTMFPRGSVAIGPFASTAPKVKTIAEPPTLDELKAKLTDKLLNEAIRQHGGITDEQLQRRVDAEMQRYAKYAKYFVKPSQPSLTEVHEQKVDRVIGKALADGFDVACEDMPDGSTTLDMKPATAAPQLKRVIRDRLLTPGERDSYNAIRAQIEKDLPDLIRQYHAQMAKPAVPCASFKAWIPFNEVRVTIGQYDTGQYDTDKAAREDVRQCGLAGRLAHVATRFWHKGAEVFIREIDFAQGDGAVTAKELIPFSKVSATLTGKPIPRESYFVTACSAKHTGNVVRYWYGGNELQKHEIDFNR